MPHAMNLLYSKSDTGDAFIGGCKPFSISWLSTVFGGMYDLDKEERGAESRMGEVE